MATEVIDQFRDVSNQQLVNAGDSANNAVRVNVVVGGGGGGGTSTVVQGTASNLNATVVGTVTSVPSGTQTVAGTVAVTESGAWTVTVTQATAANLNATIVGTVTSIPSGTANVTVVGTIPVSGTVTSVPSGTQTVAGNIALTGGTSTATISGLTTEYSPNIQQALLVKDRDLIRSIEQLTVELVKTREATLPVVVGAQFNDNGMANHFRGDKTGALIIQPAHGYYQETVLQGNVFSVQNLNALSPAVGTAIIGLTLYNPINSGKRLALIDVGGYILTGTGTNASVRMSMFSPTNAQMPVAAPSGTSVETIIANLIGNPTASVAVAYSTATFAAQPIPFMPLMQRESITLNAAGTNAAAIASTFQFANVILDGLVIVNPGSFIVIGGNSTAYTLIGYASWEEISI